MGLHEPAWSVAISVLGTRCRCDRKVERDEIPERHGSRDAARDFFDASGTRLGQGHVAGEAMMRTFFQTLGIAALVVVASAHVGGPDTWFEGNAGPYRLTVQVETAGVI